MPLLKTEKRDCYEDGSDGLLLAVFLRTVEDYVAGDIIAIEDVSGQNGSGIFSFSSLCSYFRLNRAAIKRKLDNLSQSELETLRWRCEFRVNSPARKDPPLKICPTCGSQHRSRNMFCTSDCRRGHQKNSGRKRASNA